MHAHSGRRGKAISDNFVRLNMKVKKFSKRPGHSLSGSAYKRHMWKKRQNQETVSGVGGAGIGGARKRGRSGGCNTCSSVESLVTGLRIALIKEAQKSWYIRWRSCEIF